MPFKYFFIARVRGYQLFLSFTLLCFCLLILSCADKTPPAYQQEFTDESIVRIQGCFKDYSGKIERYLKGDLPSDKIANFWLCHIDLIELVLEFRKKNFRGDPQDEFTSTEIKNILIKFVPGSSAALNANIYKAAFRFKKLILGGEESSIRRQELFALAQKLRSYQQASLKLKNKIPILARYMANSKSVTYKEMKSVWPQVNTELKKLISELFAQDVSFIDLKDVLVDLISSQKTKKQLDSIVLALDQYTSIFVGTNKKANNLSVIDNFLNLINIYIHGSIGWQAWANGHENHHLISMLTNLLNSLESSIQERSEQKIAIREWQRLFDRVSVFASVENKNIGQALGKTWVNFLKRFFGGLTGDLHLSQIEILRKGLLSWQQSLSYYPATVAPTAAVAAQKSVNCGSVDNLAIDNYLDASSFAVHCSFLPFQVNDSGKFYFLKQRADNFLLSEKSFLAFNIKHVFLRPIYRVYGNGNYNLSSKELDILFSELVGPWADVIGENFDVTAFYKKTLIETDLLTPYSNGDGEISLYELSSFAQFALSSYESSQQILQSFSQTCFVNKKLNSECLYRNFQNYKNRGLDHFPELVDYIIGFQAKDRLKSYFNLGLSIVTGKDRLSLISKFDVVELMILWHYSESFFLRHDIDQNFVLSYQEILNSFSLVEGALTQQLSQLDPNTDIQSTYSFLMAKGYLINSEPTINPNELLVHQHWVHFPNKRKSSSERKTLLQVLAAIIGLIN